MKAAVLYEYGKPLSIDTVDLQEPQEKEVLVRIMASGVCHSDLHVQKGELPMALPIVLGHEGAGIVESVGKGVTSVKKGDHVVLSLVTPCGRCNYCVAGRPNLCDLTTQAIWAGGLIGGAVRLSKGGTPIHHMSGVSSFAEYAVVREEAAIKIDPDIPLSTAALVGCGVMTGVGAAINTAQIEPGSTVIVTGCGGVGLNIIQGAALAGAGKILAVDVMDYKLELAKGFGATHIVNSKDADPVQMAKDLSRGAGFDFALDASGNSKAILQGFQALKRHGTMVMVGIPPAGVDIPFPGISLIIEEKRVIGSNYGSARPSIDMPRILDLYRSKKLKLDELVSRTLRLDQVNEAFEVMEKGEVARSVLLPHG